MSLSPSDSILKSTKKLLGIDAGYDAFDPDIITNINSAFFSLMEVGVGPKTPFMITGDDEVWTDFVNDKHDLGLVKMYIYFKTKLAFDPPTSSSVIESINNQLSELIWRMNAYSDSDFKESWLT